MRLRLFLISLLTIISAYSAPAQDKGELTQSKVLILLDESSSMVQPWYHGKEKYKAAYDIILNLMDSLYAVNDEVEFSLRAFGEQHSVEENDCYDTKNEVAFSKDNRTQMSLRLADLRPFGVTPIAFALQEAAEKDLVDEQHNAYSIILITDGGESCGGNICDVVKKLLNKKIYFKPYILSLVNDSGLKTEYSCLGNYLQVTKEEDIPKAVGTIVEAFRPMLKLTHSDHKQLTSGISTVTPSILKVNTPNFKMPVPEKEGAKLEVKPIPHDTVAVVQPPPTQSKTHNIVVGDVPEVAVVKEKTPYITTSSKMRLPILYVDEVFTPRKIPPMPVPKDLITKPVTPPPVKPAKTPTVKTSVPPVPEPATKEAKYTEQQEDAKETTVEVYFTNGRGKFYNSTPQVLLLDAANGKQVKKFYRTVDASGNPDPQENIPVGKYNLAIVGKRNLVASGVGVVVNKRNKIMVIVKNSSLKFEYEGAPDRPVQEFLANVIERDVPDGKIVHQKCTEQLEYEPGNYHIEINTLPLTRRNVDLDLDDETIIQIPQPGYAHFVTSLPLSKATLYCMLGDKFVSFITVNINDPALKRLQLQPGQYQAHFLKDPSKAYSLEKVLQFSVVSKQVTEVELK